MKLTLVDSSNTDVYTSDQYGKTSDCAKVGATDVFTHGLKKIT